MLSVERFKKPQSSTERAQFATSNKAHGVKFHTPDLPLQPASTKKPPDQGLDLNGGSLSLFQLSPLLTGLTRFIEELGFGRLCCTEHFCNLPQRRDWGGKEGVTWMLEYMQQVRLGSWE